MSEEYEIKAIGYTSYGEKLRFGGFRLKDICGIVDPFIDGNLNIPELLAFENEDGEIHDVDGFIEAEMSWAKSKIGSKLLCESLLYSAFATTGKVSFITLAMTTE